MKENKKKMFCNGQNRISKNNIYFLVFFFYLQDVNDEAMAMAYGNLQGTISKKFAGKKRASDGGQITQQPQAAASGPELMEQGQALMDKIKQNPYHHQQQQQPQQGGSQNRTWVNKNNSRGGRGSGGGKRKKFMKPRDID